MEGYGRIMFNKRVSENNKIVVDLAFEVIRLTKVVRELEEQVKKNKDDISGSKRELTKVKIKLENN